MSQDLLKMSPEALQLELYLISFGTLKQLYVRLYQHMRNTGSVMTDAEIISTQRKLTKIQCEIKKRAGKLGDNFNFWEKKLMRDLRRA